jgi:hypothetical protein
MFTLSDTVTRGRTTLVYDDRREVIVPHPRSLDTPSSHLEFEFDVLRRLSNLASMRVLVVDPLQLDLQDMRKRIEAPVVDILFIWVATPRTYVGLCINSWWYAKTCVWPGVRTLQTVTPY